MQFLTRLSIRALLATATVTLALAPAAASTVGPSGSLDRVIRDARISEASGLAASLRHPGVVWTHNDSGHAAQLFAVRPDGTTAAAVSVAGVAAVDWEAVAAYRDAAGRAMLAVADIGDNAATRASVSVVVLPEPALKNATLRPERVLRLRYPAGPVDAEALLVDPDGRRMFIVSKGFGGKVYQVPSSAWPPAPGSRPAGASAVPLVARAGVPLVLVTDGVMGPGGHPLLRTYSELAVLPPIKDDADGGSLEPLAVTQLPAQRQGEALALVDGTTVLVGGEGVGEAIRRVELPSDLVAALRPKAGPSTRPTRTPAAAGHSSADRETADRGASGGRAAGWRALSVIALSVAAVAVAAGQLRRRRRSR